MNRCGFDDMTECIKVINTELLMDHLATRRALYLSIVPLDHHLILKTHLQLIVLIELDGGTKNQVPREEVHYIRRAWPVSIRESETLVCNK